MTPKQQVVSFEYYALKRELEKAKDTDLAALIAKEMRRLTYVYAFVTNEQSVQPLDVEPPPGPPPPPPPEP